MKKNIKFILITVLLAVVLSLSLVGCTKTPNLKGGDPTATTYNNNSLVVSQGDYIYFVNGKITVDDIAEKKDNKYGKVVKSAIYRAKKDGSEPEVLVPQVAMDSNNANGISVLGKYVYFTSPSTATAKDGTLQKNNTDFYRVEISGKKLKKLVTLEGNTNQYKFTDNGLIYVENNELVYLSYSGKSETILEYAGNTYFPVTSTYVPEKADATMAVYYTESPEENDGDPYNDIKCVTSTGEVKTILSGKDSKATYSIKSVESESNGQATVYYEKTVYDMGEEKNTGLYGIKLGSDFKVANGEKRFAASGASVRYINYEKGVYVFEDSKMYIPVFDSDGLMQEGDNVYYVGTTITQSNIVTIREEAGKNFIYYTESNMLMKIEMDVKEEGNNNNVGRAEKVIEKDIVTDYVKPVLNGNTFYYINSGLYNYMYKVDISTKDAKHSLLGVRTDVDKTAYIKLVKEMDEEAREKHDKYIAEDLPAGDLKKD